MSIILRKDETPHEKYIFFAALRVYCFFVKTLLIIYMYITHHLLDSSMKTIIFSIIIQFTIFIGLKITPQMPGYSDAVTRYPINSYSVKRCSPNSILTALGCPHTESSFSRAGRLAGRGLVNTVIHWSPHAGAGAGAGRSWSRQDPALSV